MAKAKCRRCKIELEKDKREKIGNGYYCYECYPIVLEEKKEKEESKNKTKCKVCSKEVNKTECVKKGSKYVCKECSDKLDRETKAYKDLVDYTLKIFNTDKVDGLVLKHIKDYKDNYNYTYGGIQYTLWYCKEILKMSFDQKYGLGIVKMKYIEAENYFISTQKRIENSVNAKHYEKREITIKLDKVFGSKKPILINLDEI